MAKWRIYAFFVLILGVQKCACAIFYAFCMSGLNQRGERSVVGADSSGATPTSHKPLPWTHPFSLGNVEEMQRDERAESPQKTTFWGSDSEDISDRGTFRPCKNQATCSCGKTTHLVHTLLQFLEIFSCVCGFYPFFFSLKTLGTSLPQCLQWFISKWILMSSCKHRVRWDSRTLIRGGRSSTNFLVVPSQELAEQRNLNDWCQLVSFSDKTNKIHSS